MSEDRKPGLIAQPEDHETAARSGVEAGNLSPVKRALQEIRELRSKLKAADEEAAERQAPIAIVGMGMRFPGGIHDAKSLWEFLVSGRDAITDIPRERWDWRTYYNANPEARGSKYAVRGGFLEEIDAFDANFFGIAPREASMLDPQQRLLHEVAWHALEDAGVSPESLRDTSYGVANAIKTGIFLGLSNVDYYRAAFADDRRIDAYAGSGNSPSMAAGRLAYTLGVHGPAITVDTSCSSSLVAVHLAVQSLRSGESDVALAGGVNVILGPQMHIAFSRAHMLAPDGHCKTFDAAADGYVRSEGCGVVVLKRLRDAVANQDRILAVIRGTATNHDGRSGGLTAPSSRAQAALMRQAHANAGIDANSIQVIEAHGTGTSLGDPIEMEALGEVFRARSRDGRKIWVGSIKTNLGHTEAASGIAGLLKLVVSLQHKTIPAHLHFNTPSPFIPWNDLPLSIPTQATEWRLEEGQARRTCGVSSFGFSGSNAHVVLEEFSSNRDETPDPDNTPRIAALSARTPGALRSAIAALEASIKANPSHRVADICGTLARGRMHFAYRAAWSVTTREQLKQRLAESRIEQQSSLKAVSGEPAICFLFTGQGSEHTAMGLALYDHSPVFAKAINRLEGALGGSLGTSIPTVWANAHGELDSAALVQPALYAYGWALSELWQSWGIEPNIVLGHSLGEYIAATVAGVMTPEEGIVLVAARGRLTEKLALPGGMIALSMTPADVTTLLSAHPRLSVAAVNGPASVVVSGELEALQKLEMELESASLRYKRLRTTHGFHSAALEPMIDAFREEARRVNFRPPAVRWICNGTGRLADASVSVDAQYWCDHLRSTVQFSQSLATARFESSTADEAVYLEIGAQPQLSFLAADHGLPAVQIIASIRRGTDEGEWQKVHAAAAQIYCCGGRLKWDAIQSTGSFSSVTLPGYPFERKRYWFDDGGVVKPNASDFVAGAVMEQSEFVPISMNVAQIALRAELLNRWAKSLMIDTLKELGCTSIAEGLEGTCISGNVLVQSHGLVSSQVKLVERWFKWLSQDGYLVHRGDRSKDQFVFGDLRGLRSPAELWQEVDPLLEGEDAQREYLRLCADSLIGVLRGEINPLETLFPNGDETLARNLYEKSSAAVYLNRIVAAAVSARVTLRPKTPLGYARRLRILEIGAGTGATTAAILKQLSPEEVDYTFSDVSEVFLARGRQRFREHSIDFAHFDLERDEDAHAYAGHFDVVVIANALHVARDLRAALARVLRVLQPGGTLVLLETTAEFAWSDVSIGTIEGWQHFEDEARTDSPLLPVDRWVEELAAAGFEQGTFVPMPHQPTSDLGLHVVVAHRPMLTEDDRVESRPDAARFLALSGRSPLAESAYESSLEAHAVSPSGDESSVPPLREELNDAPSRERLEIVTHAVLVAVARVLGQPELPPKDARLMELGMDSLMAMELRNTLQKSFGIPELSTTVMFDYPTSSAIAGLLLSELGYTSNGEAVQPETDAPQDAQSDATSVEVHSTADLDAMSDDEIAVLLRARLGV